VTRFVVVFSLALALGCAGLSPAPEVALAAPVHAEVPATVAPALRPDPTFPTAPIEALCGRPARPRYAMAPEGRFEAVFARLDGLPPARLTDQICATTDRQVVAVGFTLLGATDPRFLRIAADTYAEPVSMATMAGNRHDPQLARYGSAAARIARDASARTGSSGISRRVAMASGDRSSIDPPASRGVDERTRGWVDDRVALYETLYARGSADPAPSVTPRSPRAPAVRSRR
jgi:hypothetical protein